MRTMPTRGVTISFIVVVIAAAAIGTADSAAAAETNSGEVIVLRPAGPAAIIEDTKAMPTGMRVLYAPADQDVPAFRAAIARLVGGSVDYFDARIGTPSAGVLSSYDCVFTYPNFAYDNNVAMGDNLAAAVDAGKTMAILGSWSVPTASNFLSGQIMTADYCPVMTPTGSTVGSYSTWAGGGVPAFTDGVFDFGSGFRDELAIQGNGHQFSSYLDGEIAIASRFTDFRVTYLNGANGIDWENGDWPLLVANACRTGAVDVLVYEDDTENSWAVGGVYSLSANFSVVGSSQFNSFLTAPELDWDLVLVDCPNNTPTGGWGDLISWVNGGGPAVMSFWDWDNSSGVGDPDLASAFGYTGTTTIELTASDTYAAAVTPGGSHVHAGVGDLPNSTWSETWGDDGDVFSLAPGAEVLGGISGGAASGPVVIRNPDGNAVASFVLDSWESSEAERLWRNLAMRVLDRTDFDGRALEVSYRYPDVGTVLESHEVVVGPMAEVTDDMSILSFFSLNLHGPYIVVDFSDFTSFGPASFAGWVFHDLTGELPAIGGAWLDGVSPEITGLDADDIEYDEDWVSINIESISVGAPSKFRVKVFFGIWADGFESGDTQRWSSTVGGP